MLRSIQLDDTAVLSALMLVVSPVIAVATAIYSLAAMEARHERFGYYPLSMLLMMGVNGAFLTATSSTCTSGSK
jgi:formate hydrogenlyase subunit 3/multisubunit Na+/H+ antiporter MnhD subunit